MQWNHKSAISPTSLAGAPPASTSLATETVMAAKDVDAGGAPAKLVGEMADLWFHCMVALAHYGLKPADVLAELERREGLGGLEEKALRKAREREGLGE